MKEKISPFLREYLHLSHFSNQYVKNSEEKEDADDPLKEEEFERVRGLIHKYPNRALIKVSYLCAAHCRFCTRIRQIGKKEGTLNEADILSMVDYIKHHPEIEDVILSGGDPLYTPKLSFDVWNAMSEIPSIKVMRIGTRLPFQLPGAIESGAYKPLLEAISRTSEKRPVFVMLHAEHPDEITPESLKALRILKETGATLMSQTVLLKGVNDEISVLLDLCRKLYFNGVIPYYLYRCDRVKGLERFWVEEDKERRLARDLRIKLSGIACPLLVEDSESTNGKWPVHI